MALIDPIRDAMDRVPSGRSYNLETELLKRSGIIKTRDGIEGHFLEQMAEVGLDSRSVLTRVAMIMDGGESDGVKLAAARLALTLHMHPALVPRGNKDTNQAPNITFVVNTPEGSKTPLNMQAVITPNYTTEDDKD